MTIRRREFITLVGGAAAYPLAASAQSEAVRRIGMLMGGLSENESTGRALATSLMDGLRALGWREGRNLQVEFRWPGDDADRLQASAVELAHGNLDLIVAANAPAVAALKRATSSIPIVQVTGADPVALGFVVSLAKPGANITGFPAQEPAMGGKWFEVLKEIAPGMSRVMILQDKENPNRQLYSPPGRSGSARTWRASQHAGGE
jgi:putative tryptophan/tyrosine transport system substrate-binding protein